MRMHTFQNALPLAGILGQLQIVGALAIEPELRAVAKEGTQTDGCIPGDGTLARHYGLNAALGHACGQPQLCLAQFQRAQELLQQNFPRVYRGHAVVNVVHYPVLLMIINYFDVVGVVFTPDKTDAPLDVDANAELPLSVALQRLQPIGRGHLQVLQGRGAMQNFQLALSGPQKLLGQAGHTDTIKQCFCFFVLERLYHTKKVTRVTCFCKRSAR